MTAGRNCGVSRDRRPGGSTGGGTRDSIQATAGTRGEGQKPDEGGNEHADAEQAVIAGILAGAVGAHACAVSLSEACLRSVSFCSFNAGAA